MKWKSEWKILLFMAAVFLVAFYLPAGRARFDSSVMGTVHLLRS